MVDKAGCSSCWVRVVRPARGYARRTMIRLERDDASFRGWMREGEPRGQRFFDGMEAGGDEGGWSGFGCVDCGGDGEDSVDAGHVEEICDARRWCGEDDAAVAALAGGVEVNDFTEAG